MKKTFGEKSNVSISRLNNVINTARTLADDMKYQIKRF